MKYSDESMLTRSDMIILMQQVDVTKAYDLLAMFKEAGKERIDIRTILDEVAPKIKDYSALVARLEQLSGNHATCSITEFAAWLKVSRLTREFEGRTFAPHRRSVLNIIRIV